MQTIDISNIKEIKKITQDLEKKLNIKTSLKGKTISIDGKSLQEYEASIIIDAINSGFSAQKALLLIDEEYTFRKIHIKDFTRRKNLEEVRARIIGTKGKTKSTIEELGGCYLTISDTHVSLIAPSEKVEEITTGITNLIKGSKQANVYRFLEQMNTLNKDRNEDLGLKKI